MTAGYEDRAADWIRLARTEGHDAYWRYRDSFFEVIQFPFASRRFPLEAYSRALESAGIAVEALREPPLPGAGGHRRTRIPLFLLWRAVKRGDGA